MKTTKEILIEARNNAAANNCDNLISIQLIHPKRENCFCALGHIANAMGYPVRETSHGYKFVNMDNSPIDSMYDILEYSEAVKRLADALENPPWEHVPRVYRVYNFNDNAVHQMKKHKVIELFDKAIASCD